MTFTEVIAIIGGLAFGYWIVSGLINNNSNSSEGSDSTHDTNNESQHDRYRHNSSNNERHANDDDIQTEWHRILGIPENASNDQVTTAYKKMIRQYHPDKVSQMGEEIRKVAEYKSKQINAAYNYAMKRRD